MTSIANPLDGIDEWSQEDEVVKIISTLFPEMILTDTLFSLPEDRKKLFEEWRSTRSVFKYHDVGSALKFKALMDYSVALFAREPFLVSLAREGLLAFRSYKGLGVMNASQLWETTLDPNARTLAKVEVDQTDEADPIPTAPMGDRIGLYGLIWRLWFNAQTLCFQA